MAFEFTVVCDGCQQRKGVPSAEAFPLGWIQLRWPVPNVNGGAPRPEIKTACSWKCIIKIAGDYVREEAGR